MTSSELKSLLEQYFAGTLAEEDFKRLWATLANRKYDGTWLSAIDEVIVTTSQTTSSDQEKADDALTRLKAKIGEEGLPQEPSPVHRMFSNGRAIIRYAAAIVVILSVAIFMLVRKQAGDTQPETAQAVNALQDVEPGGEKAILTLADGSTIVLDNAANGKIAQQGNVQVVKLSNGQIQYHALKQAPHGNGQAAYNTMSTPRGGQFQLILPDGSKVWLNAESSITYPVVFAANERKVKITGEVYFEVEKDKTKPFRVSANEQQVEVLGTHFNIKAYAGDGPAKTSLLEGSVKIDKQILKPGQAFMNGEIIATNIEQDVAWKNGIFNFNNQNLSQVMRQLARWYDLEIVYPHGIPGKEYGGEIGRNLKLAQVLKGLENSGVHFEVIGKRVVVSPAKTE